MKNYEVTEISTEFKGDVLFFYSRYSIIVKSTSLGTIDEAKELVQSHKPNIRITSKKTKPEGQVYRVEFGPVKDNLVDPIKWTLIQGLALRGWKPSDQSISNGILLVREQT